MARHVLLSFLLWGFAVVANSAEPGVEKWVAPETQEAEIRRWLSLSEDELLTSYRLNWSPQFQGAPALIALAATSFRPLEPYRLFTYPPVHHPSQLFGEDRVADKAPGLSRPTLAPLRDATIRVFDRSGNTPEAWQGTTSTNGYLFDFNNDDNLDLAAIESRAITLGADEYKVDLVKITTIEAQPRILAQIVFNCRLSFVSETEDWGALCETLDHAGCPILAFGPNATSNDQERHQFLVHWDAGKGGFEMLQVPEDEAARRHLRILDGDASLEDFIQQGGLGHPLRPAPPSAEVGPVVRKPYVFHSLKDSSDRELAAFFNGEPGRKAPSPELPEIPPLLNRGSSSESKPQKEVPPAVSLPEQFWHSEPKEAALTFANANRDPGTRLRWLLAVDDRPPATPPSSGWLNFEWKLSDDDNPAFVDISLRFGVAEPWLLIRQYTFPRTRDDSFPANPVYHLQTIPLSPGDARFLADTLYWMDQLRAARTLSEASKGSRSGNSPPVGEGILECFEDGQPPRKVARAFTHPLEGGFDRRDFITLAARLLLQHLPAHLQEQQRRDPSIVFWSPAFSSDRIPESQKPKERAKKLQAILSPLLQRSAEDPLPPSILSKLIACAGDERITGLKRELAALQATVAPQTSEERDLEAIERTFAENRLWFPDDHESPAFSAMIERDRTLTAKFEYDRSHILRPALDKALRQLSMADQPEALKKASRGTDDLAYWALDVLRSEYPKIHAAALIERFPTAEAYERRIIFDFLITHQPDQAAPLIERMTSEHRTELLPEITNFERKHFPEGGKQRAPELLKIIADRSVAELRFRAIECLGQMQLDPKSLVEFESLLVRELDESRATLHNPNSGPSTLLPVVSALSRLPDAAAHLARIESLSPREAGSFDGFMAAVNRACSTLPNRDEHLLHVLKLRLEQQDTDMSRVFVAALAFDLRAFGPDAETFATDSSSIRDGYETRTLGPGDLRYHAARIAAAIWKETDPETLARMWTALALAERYYGISNDPFSIPSQLANRTKQALLGVPADKRQPLVEGMIIAAEATTGSTETIAWLRKLAKEGS